MKPAADSDARLRLGRNLLIASVVMSLAQMTVVPLLHTVVPGAFLANANLLAATSLAWIGLYQVAGPFGYSRGVAFGVGFLLAIPLIGPIVAILQIVRANDKLRPGVTLRATGPTPDITRGGDPWTSEANQGAPTPAPSASAPAGTSASFAHPAADSLRSSTWRPASSPASPAHGVLSPSSTGSIHPTSTTSSTSSPDPASRYYPSREQLEATYGAMATEEIEGRIGIGRLTPMAHEVAVAELLRRDPHAQLPEPMDGPPLLARHAPPALAAEQPGGWSFGTWALVYGALVFAGLIKFASLRYPSKDPGTLFVVMLVAAAVGTVGINLLVQVFTGLSTRGVLKKLIWVGLIGVVLFYLTMCGALMHHGWGGG